MKSLERNGDLEIEREDDAKGARFGVRKSAAHVFAFVVPSFGELQGGRY
jgi:hypothetical protein